MVLREVTYLAVILRIMMAFVLGGILGLERGLKQRPAGLRTHMLVCVGACMIMLTNQYIYQVFGVGDPVRMGAQVVSGIGFLGAGTIMVTKHSQIRGLTTAAGLWATAAVGLATGIGFYEAAGMGTLVMVLTLTVLSILDSKMHKKTRCFEIYVELHPTMSLGIFLDCVRSKGIVIEDVQMEPSRDPESGSRRFMMVVITHRRLGASELMVQLQDAAPDVRMEIF
jgi:putative Mg2+ transporter-C (MgtC) family protein